MTQTGDDRAQAPQRHSVSGDFVLQARGVRKSFGGIEVLKGVDLDVRKGEVHALMGENGAGKSTIIKIITGVYTKEEGQLYIDGSPVSIEDRRDASRHGISVIYQELSLIQTLTVAQNIFLGQELTRYRLTKKREMSSKVRALIERYGFDIDPDAEVARLGMAQRQMVEILKALSVRARLIIMDEPTSALSAADSEKLFETIGRLRDKGVSILYISHRLEEVYRLADRLTVMRDGENVGVLARGDINAAAVTTLMIGHEVRHERSRAQNIRDDLVLEVKDLHYRDLLQGVSLTARGGEILGIGGLVGSGRTELIRCIYGAERPSSGSITLNGQPTSRSIARNMREGFGFVPEDRRGEGFVPLLPIGRNIALASYDRLARLCFVDLRRERDFGDETIGKYDIRPPVRSLMTANLSGGNQQKVVLGKWLSRSPRVLLLDEPTAGVDVGVKEELYRYMREMADAGAIIVMVSSDLAELTHVSDRILVLHGGRVFEEFAGDATQADVLMASSGEHTEAGRAL
ncbi:MAG: sugar ABC transporter ATP-binding protein [Clostridiales Family XIII bacterium]|jgi:ribose transport system ATP-binding protein|nr:sugar ABC transporter ATP-binding protein [Clostridiales Family XIII bacterium]